MVDTATHPNPFPGLRSFEPDEDHLFFGRESRIDELLTRLRRSRFLSVVGTSGSGKSSLIRSGLIPSLYSGLMTSAGSSWRVVLFRPGENPVGNLAEALNDPEAIGPEEEYADTNRAFLEVTLRRSGMGLVECIRQARVPDHENILVVVDQFEELFRFKHSLKLRDARDEAVAFVKLLLSAANQQDVPVYVVITMRSDFIGNCTEFEGLTEAINQGQYLVPRMTREERRSAIVGPVAVGGAEIAPRLVLRLLNDVGDDPDQLPILQHALMRTWDFWEANHTDSEPLDLRHYEAIGTMTEALSQHAEEAFRELPDDRSRDIAEKMFKALTDRGSDARGVRNPRLMEEICALADADETTVANVVEVFRRPGRSFLMPPSRVELHGSSIVDISHESLMRIWARLIRWVDEEARSAQVYLRISKGAAEYQEGKAGLLRDPELQLSLNWREETKPNNVWAERYDVAFERAVVFLDHSERQRNLEIEEKERQRKRQLQWARRLAIVLGSAAIITLLFGLYAMVLKFEADDQRHFAELQREEAERQREEADRQRTIAVEQRTIAVEQREIAEDERQIADEQREIAVEQRQIAIVQEQEAVRQRQQAEAARVLEAEARSESEQQRTIAVEQKERANTMRVQAEISEAEAQRLRKLSVARELAIQTSRLAQEGQEELAALLALQAYRLHSSNQGDPSEAVIFDALRTSLERLAPDSVEIFRYHQDAIRCLATTATTNVVASGSDDGTVRLLDLDAPKDNPTIVGAPTNEVRDLVWVDAEKGIASGALDGVLRLWNPSSGIDEPTIIGTHATGITAMTYRGEGRILVSGDLDGELRVWRLDAPGESSVLRPAGGSRIEAAVFVADGRLAAADSQPGVLLWGADLGQQAPERILPGRNIVSLGAGSGGALVAGTRQGPILYLRSGLEGPPLELVGHGSTVTSLDFDRTAERLASASLDGSIRLWVLDQPDREPITLPDHAGWVWDVAFTADGERLVSGGADRTLRTWPTRTSPLAEAICEHSTRNLSAEEWSDFLPEDITWEATCPGLGSDDDAPANATGSAG